MLASKRRRMLRECLKFPHCNLKAVSHRERFVDGENCAPFSIMMSLARLLIRQIIITPIAMSYSVDLNLPQDGLVLIGPDMAQRELLAYIAAVDLRSCHLRTSISGAVLWRSPLRSAYAHTTFEQKGSLLLTKWDESVWVVLMKASLSHGCLTPKGPQGDTD